MRQQIRMCGNGEYVFPMEEWKIDLTIYQSKCKKFDEVWVKAYALILYLYCSRYVQLTIKEMPDFDRIIIKDHLVVFDHYESLMHKQEKVSNTFLD